MEELTLAATLGNMEAVADFVNQQLEELDCPMKAMMQIDVALDEILSNIVRYAYGPEGGLVTVQMETAQAPRAVKITFIDNGPAFNPLSCETPDTTLSAEERNIGGLGILIVKKSMDEISYDYRDNQNVLTMKKEF